MERVRCNTELFQQLDNVEPVQLFGGTSAVISAMR